MGLLSTLADVGPAFIGAGWIALVMGTCVFLGLDSVITGGSGE